MLALSALALIGVALPGASPVFPPSTQVGLVQADTQEVRLPSGMSFPRLRRVLAELRPRAAAPSSGAEPDSAGSRVGVPGLEITGLVIDETVTGVGRDFYGVFHGAWTPPAGLYNYTIRIQEQPVPTLGTRVIVLLNDEPLFQLQLQPRYEVVEQLARQAAQYTAQEVERRFPRAGAEAAGDAGPASRY